jgi:hypothetical protein
MQLAWVGRCMVVLDVASAWAVALDRGAPAEVARSFAVQLGGFSLLTSLPLWGAVYVVGQLIRKRWLATLVLALGAMIWALSERVLEQSASTLPLPGLLLRRLLSGDAEQVQHALGAGWGIAGMALAAAVAARVWAERRMSRSPNSAELAYSTVPVAGSD